MVLAIARQLRQREHHRGGDLWNVSPMGCAHLILRGGAGDWQFRRCGRIRKHINVLGMPMFLTGSCNTFALHASDPNVCLGTLAGGKVTHFDSQSFVVPVRGAVPFVSLPTTAWSIPDGQDLPADDPSQFLGPGQRLVEHSVFPMWLDIFHQNLKNFFF